ncbi:Cullin-domain-containing protein [Aureobasidium pullulans]|uniref:Cullin-domain-containing protein n=2 Tax=Aureobasidium pullulans TaxID=5580 RepID=A0A4S9W6X8_AURPU|nr:Cullin-domain-containing protein [Aureobasidium pullulans]THZ93339.1 Cullin-domain-containing protein [Aureobasidium pullulans]TIA33602.1 Cullin-domain-containing protein [Aureobasidium pullulans]
MSIPQSLNISTALCLIKSKPKHLTVQEYIRALRPHIRTIHSNGQVYRQIDHSAFWQDQHDGLKATLEKERDATFILKQQNDALESQVTQLLARSKPGRKRKVEQEEPEKVKKLKAGTIAITEFGLAANIDPVIKAMRHIHRVQTLCRGRMWSTDSNELAYNLIQTMQAMENIIDPLANKKHSADSCKQTITAVARTCITVFHGLKRMESLNSNDGFPSHVVHACVCFFGILFTSIENAARLQVESKQPDRGTAVLQALSTLANSLINILRGSSPNCPSHAEILEGATYDLLHRLGETTHELLMDGPQHDDIEHEVQKLPLPDDKRLDPVRQTVVRTMLTAAPFLLDCLRKALIGAQDQPLAAFARLKLQRTLVDRIFGPGTRGPNASEDVLGLPEVFGEPPTAANPIKKEDIQTKTDQFEEEIWALVGWDILAFEDRLHCFDTYNKLFEMSCSHDLALDVFFINLESAGSGCKVVEQQSHDEKVLQRGHSCTPASMPPSISSLPAGDRSPSSSPPHPPARKRKRPSAATTAAATPSASSQPPASLGRQQSIQNLFADQASAAASPSTATDSSPNRKKVKNQPFNMQSDMYSFSSKVIGGNLPAATSTTRRTPGRLNKGFTPKAGTTKLVVKTLKPQPAWDGNKYFEDTWAQLDRALNVIFTQAPVDFSMEELYRGVENLCRQKRAEEIYVKLSSKCKAHVRGPVKTSLLSKQKQSNVQVLDDVLGAWTAWSKQMTVIRCIFYYMDRSYLLQTSRGSLQDVTIKIFRDNIFEDPNLKLAIIDGACDLISADRAGQELEPSHLSQAITMFHDLATYSTSFEPRMLASAQRYVVEWANEKSAEKPLPEYVNEAITFMTKEIERCELFDTGSQIVFDDKNDTQMVVRLLSLKTRLDHIWRTSFHRSEELGHALRESFETFINKTKKAAATHGTDNSRTGEMIAKYVDQLLRGGAKVIPTDLTLHARDNAGKEEFDDNEAMDEDSEVNAQLDQVLDLFRFVHGKAVFEAFYKKDLARRLLMGRSASADAERSMLARLKTECGAEFTHNLEQMFKDVELAREEMSSYKSRMEEREERPKVDLNVNVLSAAAWPTYPDVPVVIPADIKTAIDEYERHYKSKHSGRKLDWKHSLAHCQMKAKFAKGTKELVVSSFQAIILLLFNGIDASTHLTYDFIKSESGLPEAEVNRTLQSLACAKLRPLAKHPKGREISPTDTFTVDPSFWHDKYRVKINQVQLKETKEENKETHERVAADRNFECQAAVVRVMKSRKTIGHSELIAEVITATRSRGVLDVKDIKKNIDRLIEKDYMEREEGNMYSYIA